MIERVAYLWPEIALFLTTCVVMVSGSRPACGCAGCAGPSLGWG